MDTDRMCLMGDETQEQAEVTFVSDDEIRAITAAIVAEDAELLERLAR